MIRYWNRLPCFVSALIFLILGFAECKGQSPSAKAANLAVLPANTRVFLRLTKTLAKRDAKPSDPVELSVASDVVVNGQVIISRGTTVSGTFRGLNQNGKATSKVLLDLGPVRTTTGEMVRLAGLRTSSNQSDVGNAIGYGGEAGVLAPVIIPAFIVAEVLHRRNVLLEEGTCVQAAVARDVALDPAKILELPREQYGGSALDRAVHLTTPCNSPPIRKISEYRDSVERNPDDPAARIGLIESLDDSGDVDAAFGEAREAIRIWPDDAYLRFLLGRLLVERDEPDAAIVELQWALKKENNHLSPANCALGRAFELKGDLKAALNQYRIAYQAHVQDEQCRAAYLRLKQQLKK